MCARKDRLTAAATWLRHQGLPKADVPEQLQIDWELRVRYGMSIEDVLRGVETRCDGKTVRKLGLA